MIRRYLIVVGLILVVVIGLGVWLKPPLSQVREDVEALIADHAHETGDAAQPADVESHDWILATSHAAKIGERTFSCFGAMKVTVCTGPE